jgi:SpoVK/Ycf46/Vps4 family AAA+-type ATPase
MAQVEENIALNSWAAANHAYLQTEMRRLRLLFARKVRWLRWNWQHDQAGDSHALVISDSLVDRLLSDDPEVAEARFYQDDEECRLIEATLSDINAELANRRLKLTEDGRIPALEALARLFSLNSLERDLLLLCFAIDDDPGFALLAAYVQDNVNLRYATPDLVFSVLCQTAQKKSWAREVLLASAPLRRFRLLVAGDAGATTSRSMQALGIDERISDYLRGINRFDDRVVHLLRPVLSEVVVGSHCELIDQLCHWAESAAGQAWPPFHFSGPKGAGKRAVAAEFCTRFGVQLYALDVTRLPLQDAERHELMHLMERETAISRVATYIDLSEIDLSDRVLAGSVRDWVEHAGGMVFVASRERYQFQRQVNHVSVARLDSAAQKQIWSVSLAGMTNSVDGEVDALVQQFQMGPGAILNAVASAVQRAHRREGDFKLLPEDLWQTCREQVGWQLGSLAQPLTPCYCWDDIVVPDDLLRQLHEIADQVATRSEVYDRWGFGSRLTRGRGISALFSGPSGTGKTMAAEILANHLELDLYRIDLAGVVSKYIGETEKNLRNVFDAAEESGAILFFDEADALFGKRTEVRDSHDRYANIEVNYLLQRMEDYRGLAILCTNRRSALDRAFLRRLRFLVEFPFPDGEKRRQIWSKVFPVDTPVLDLNLDELARLEITGGNIHNIALNAAFLAAHECASIQMLHLRRAARREYAKIDKLLTEAEFGSQYRSIS